MSSRDLEDVLDEAVRQHFCRLFEILMRDPSDQGIERFRTGLRRLAEMEEAVTEIIVQAAKGD